MWSDLCASRGPTGDAVAPTGPYVGPATPSHHFIYPEIKPQLGNPQTPCKSGLKHPRPRVFSEPTPQSSIGHTKSGHVVGS